jgi:hypothetical protein
MTSRILNKKFNRLIQESMLGYQVSFGGTRMVPSDRSYVFGDL